MLEPQSLSIANTAVDGQAVTLTNINMGPGSNMEALAMSAGLGIDRALITIITLSDERSGAYRGLGGGFLYLYI